MSWFFGHHSHQSACTKKADGWFFSNRNLHLAASLYICVWEEENSCETDVSVSQNDHSASYLTSSTVCLTLFVLFFPMSCGLTLEDNIAYNKTVAFHILFQDILVRLCGAVVPRLK